MMSMVHRFIMIYSFLNDQMVLIFLPWHGIPPEISRWRRVRCSWWFPVVVLDLQCSQHHQAGLGSRDSEHTGCWFWIHHYTGINCIHLYTVCLFIDIRTISYIYKYIYIYIYNEQKHMYMSCKVYCIFLLLILFTTATQDRQARLRTVARDFRDLVRLLAVA